MSPIPPTAPFPIGDQRMMVEGADGNLYGIGGNDIGPAVAFKMTPGGEVTLLHTFKHDADGASPNGLTLASDGRLYGTMSSGGSPFGNGTVFRLGTDGTFTLLHVFRGNTDGATPIGSLVPAADGNLYGITDSGGNASNPGTFFKVALDGTVSVVHVMTEASHPRALLLGSDGVLYGMADDPNFGVIFSITTSGAVTIRYRFNNGTDGSPLWSVLLQGPDGNLYGTTTKNDSTLKNGVGGIVFRVRRDGTAFSVLHVFDSFVHTLLFGADGQLYGTTYIFGDATPAIAFRATLSGAVTTLAVFNTRVQSSLLLQKSTGLLYGATDRAELFTLSTAGALTMMPQPLAWEGSAPGTLAAAQDGSVYALAGQVIFKMAADGSGRAVLRTFATSEDPPGPFVQGADGNFYGTGDGGTRSDGRAFRMSADGVVTTLHSFNLFVEGSDPSPLMLASDGRMYGTTSGGGVFGLGALFRLSTDGTASVRHAFNFADRSPNGGLAEGSDGSVYGTTAADASTKGTVYRVTGSGSFTTLHEFTGADGEDPVALVAGANGDLYGVTRAGGASGLGTIFRISASGVVTTLHAFKGSTDGRTPLGILLRYPNGNLYGATGEGSDTGTIFELKPNGTFTTLQQFSGGVEGGWLTALVQGKDTKLYGAAARGGRWGGGTIFRIGVDTTTAPVPPGPPAITSQPANVTISEVDTAVFSVSVQGTAPIAYRWQSSTDGATWTDLTDSCTALSAACRLPPTIQGAATGTLTIAQWARSRPPTSFRCVVSNSAGTATSSSATLTVVSAVRFSPAALRFRGTKTAAASTFAAVTPPQAITVTIAGTGNRWTASSSDRWLQISGGSGTGAGQFVVTVVNPDNTIGASTSLAGTITISSPSASFAFVEIPVTLAIAAPGQTAAPFGSLDTPLAGATGLQGSIAINGWALDDVGIERVEIWRDVQPGERTPPFTSPSPGDPRTGKIFIANATFVDGARPDVETANPTTPLAYRGGWGYLLLTWGLFNQGNGTDTLYAYAFDKEATLTALGQRTIGVSNAAANKPFGSIDTPAIGGTASGTTVSFGWGVTPKVNGVATCRIQPSGVQVSIDSGALQPVNFGANRTDIAAAFPGFSNSDSAGGSFVFDTTALSNGVHTIGWLITDDCGRSDGVGSRFFTVQNGSQVSTESSVASAFRRNSASDEPVLVSRGYGGLPVRVGRDAAGKRRVVVAQGERVELRLPREYAHAHQLVNGERRDLPIGSSWDAGSQTFSWQPAPGFLGEFVLVFVRGGEQIRVLVEIPPG